MTAILEKIAFYWTYPFVRYALIVGVLIALCSSLLGVTLVLKRFSFIGDGLSHVAFGAMSVAAVLGLADDLPLIDSDPGKVRAKAYDIVLNGNEIGGGSVRIFQDDIQEKMFEVLGFTKEQAYSQFGFLLDAFKYGVPPHAGLAYGLDRLVMLMAKQDSIRDVIAFPKVKDASCLMTEAPSVVDVKQLNELGLETTAETEK